jgi:CheY-like chemotaxis protein
MSALSATVLLVSDQPTYGQGYVAWAAGLTRGQLLDLVLDVEDLLRRMIRAVFARERDDYELLIPATLRERLATKSAGSPTGTPDLLEKADLSDLIGIVMNRWSVFAPIMQDQQKVFADLDSFRIWRNQLAHGKLPNTDESVEVALLIKRVHQHIPIELTTRNVVRTLTDYTSTYALFGQRILWADDRPELTRTERRWLRELGAEVVPVLSNDEAIEQVKSARFDVVISDIDRGDGESGTALGPRFAAYDIQIPILFYVGTVGREECCRWEG